MKVYTFGYDGKFLGETQADICQITEALKKKQASRELEPGEAVIETVYIKPSYSTELAPPVVQSGFEAFFNGSNWEVVEKPAAPVEPEEPEYIPTYKDKRAAAYPDFMEYLDGFAKSKSLDPETAIEGVNQMEKYASDCLAVKAQFPKE